MLCVLFLIGCCFSHPVSYSIRVSNASLLLAAICPPSLSLSPLVTQASRVKSVTLRCVSPPLCDHDAPPTMLFSQHATRPLIPHANIRFLLTAASSLHHPAPPPPPHLGANSPLSRLSLIFTACAASLCHVFALICLMRFPPFPLFPPGPHLVRRRAATGFGGSDGWPCQCQAARRNDNVYYPLRLPLPMD